MAVKGNGRRKFPALYVRIARPDVLQRSWERVRSNKGASGIDGETLKAIEARGVEQVLTELRGLLIWKRLSRASADEGKRAIGRGMSNAGSAAEVREQRRSSL